jgi:stress response protein YsnF
MHRPVPDGPADFREPHEPLARADESLAVVRSEEELVLSTRAVVHERVRLVKRIVTETVTTTTEVRREELRIERLPASEGDTTQGARPSQRPGLGRLRDWLTPLGSRLRPGSSAGGSSVPFAQQSFDVTLVEEQVVVTKRIVPRERIRVRKEIVTGEQAVADTVRKEQVELQREPATARRDPNNGSIERAEALAGDQ